MKPKFFTFKFAVVSPKVCRFEMIAPNGKVIYTIFFNLNNMSEFAISIDDLNKDSNFILIGD